MSDEKVDLRKRMMTSETCDGYNVRTEVGSSLWPYRAVIVSGNALPAGVKPSEQGLLACRSSRI